MTELVRFAEEHYPPARKWPEGRMQAWLEWASGNGFLMAIMDEGVPVGMAFAKPVKRPPSEPHSYDFDRNGSYIYINFAVAKTREIMRNLAVAIVKNIGLRPKVMYKTKGRLRIHDSQKVLEALFKVK